MVANGRDGERDPLKEEHGVVLSIAGQGCRIECPDNPAAIRALKSDLPQFVSDMEPALTVSIRFDRGMQDAATPGWKALKMERTRDGFLAHGPSHWILVLPELNRIEARIPRYFQVGTVLRIGISTILPLSGRGFLSHAAAVANREGAYLFPGLPEAGKSTVVANSPGRRALTEETAVITKENGRFQVFGFPLWARFDILSMTDQPTPLAGMFLLKKGTPRINPVSRSEALGYLLQNICFPLVDPQARERVIEVASEFVREVPCAELVFGKNPEFWRCIERG